MDALILAGGSAPPDLQAATGEDDRACVPLDGVPLVLRVLAALQNTPEIENITVVCSSGAQRMVEAKALGVSIAPADGKMIENLKRGLELTRTEQVLVCTCDIPLVRSETFSRVLAQVAARKLDVAYPIVTRAACEAAFPGGTRTYAKLQNGEFTGGNAVVIPRGIIASAAPLIDAAYNARKNVLALAKMLGPIFIARFLSKKLGIEETEAKLSKLLGCRAGAIRLEDERDAAIAFDVDKAADLQIAAQALTTSEHK